jgi:hypothetical protein
LGVVESRERDAEEDHLSGLSLVFSNAFGFRGKGNI